MSDTLRMDCVKRLKITLLQLLQSLYSVSSFRRRDYLAGGEEEGSDGHASPPKDTSRHLLAIEGEAR